MNARENNWHVKKIVPGTGVTMNNAHNTRNEAMRPLRQNYAHTRENNAHT